MSSRTRLSNLEYRAYLTAELYALGFTPKHLRGPNFRRLSHGLYAPRFMTEPSTVFDRCSLLQPVLHEGNFFSRRTALALFGLPVDHHHPIEVAAQRPHRPPRRPEIMGQLLRVGQVNVVRHRGLWVASPSDAWCQMASVASLTEQVIVGDAIISGARSGWSGRRSKALATLDELEAATHRYASGRGAKLRRAALPLLRAPVDSPAETQLRLIMRDAGLPEPVVNCPVPVHGRVLHSDLGYPELRIAIEHDGLYHFTGGARQARFDAERHEQMRDAGWRVLRTFARDLREPAHFLNRLRRALAAAP